MGKRRPLHIKAVCWKTRQDVNRDSGPKIRAQKFPQKNICQLKLQMFVVYILQQAFRSQDSFHSSTWPSAPTNGAARIETAMKTNRNGLVAISPMIMATNRNLRQWRRMKPG